MLLLVPGWAPGAEWGRCAGVILRQDQHVASFLMAGCKTAGCILTGATLGGIVVRSRSTHCARKLAFLHLQRPAPSSRADACMLGLHPRKRGVVAPCIRRAKTKGGLPSPCMSCTCRILSDPSIVGQASAALM